MKKNLFVISTVIFIFLAASFVCLRFAAGTLTVSLELPPEATEATVSFEPEGVLCTESVICDAENGRCRIVLNALSDGNTDVTVTWDQVDHSGFYDKSTTIPMRSVMNGIITDMVTFNYSGWEQNYQVFILTVLVLSAVMFFAYYQVCRQEGLYSYRAVLFFGIGLFLLVSALIELFSGIFSIGEYATVWIILLNTMTASMTFMVKTAPFIFLFSAALAVSNLVLIRKEGLFFTNMLGIITALLMSGAVFFGIRLFYSRSMFRYINELKAVYSGLVVYFECLFVSTIVSAIRAAIHTPEYCMDYVVILGCKIRSDGTLYPLIRGRVDKALSFVRKQAEVSGKDAVLVPSGGNGGDEPTSEGEAMANYIRTSGIPEEQILAEKKSATTRENMLFSKALIEKSGKTYRAAFSTSDYHVFRSGILARENGWNIEGMGCRTKWYFWPNAYIREFVGLLSDSIPAQIVAVCLITAFGILSVSVI